MDYHQYANINTPKEARRKYDIGDIYINAITCLTCGEYIRSTNRRDFKRCSCGDCAVDGGSWYAKRVGRNYKENTVMFNDVKG